MIEDIDDYEFQQYLAEFGDPDDYEDADFDDEEYEHEGEED